MTPALKDGLRVLEERYYHSKQVYAMLDYTLAVLDKLDTCLSKTPPVHGKIHVEIDLKRKTGANTLTAGRYRIVQSNIADQGGAVGACLDTPLRGTEERIVDPAIATKGTLYRTPFTFPVAQDPIYEFLATGNYKLIAGDVPPLAPIRGPGEKP